MKQYAFDLDNPKDPGTPIVLEPSRPGTNLGYNGYFKAYKRTEASGMYWLSFRLPQEVDDSGLGNEATCSETVFYLSAKTAEILYQATDLVNKYGINCLEAYGCYTYMRELNKEGILGPGKEIDCPLNFDDIGSLEFMDQFLKMVAYRNDGLGNENECGNIIAEGAVRAAEKWGRLEEDLKTGKLAYPYWGFFFHDDPNGD